MVSAREFSVAIYGAWRLATLDRSAVQFFENTEDAFWKSFNAAAIALPAYILLVLLNFTDQAVTASAFRIFAVETITYVIGWVLFPLVMLSFTETLDCGRWYLRFIAAWNWAVVLQVFLFLAVTAFAASGILPASLAGLVSLITTVAIFFYQGFIAHVMLDVRAGVAAVIVVIDFMLSILLNVVSQTFY
jgi:hypothetical protein